VNDQMASPTPAAIMNGAPEWLTLPFVLIGLGIVSALLILWWGAHLATRRKETRQELEARGETHYAGAAEPLRDPLAAPPTASSPPPIADAATPATAPVREPIATMPEPAPEAPPLADEPIAAVAPLEPSPATLAASDPGAAEPPVETADDLTRMKGIGPRLADRLNSAGITRFSQLAALTPEQADALDSGLGDFQGRIHRDRWIEQAGYLARGDVAGYEATFGKL
jgi:predicted flap endonuclease-1-like 5' DNA nuclease